MLCRGNKLEPFNFKSAVYQALVSRKGVGGAKKKRDGASMFSLCSVGFSYLCAFAPSREIIPVTKSPDWRIGKSQKK
jgi:hypothetical protein